MKAITMWQPWASLLACGAKQYETRSWATKYRGKIAIHAALTQKYYGAGGFQDILTVAANIPAWQDYITMCVETPEHEIPFGAVIAIADLAECWHIVARPGTDIDKAASISIGAELSVPKHHPRFHDYIVPTENEILFGDWTPGRYAWELTNMKMLDNPISAKGMQRLWNWEQT